MRTAILILAMALGVAAPGALPETESDALTYEVVEVKGKLMKESPAPELRLREGAGAVAGDVLRTGWWSSAEVGCPERATVFAIGPSTRATLASESPGVLLDLDRGRVRAVFDKVGTEISPERLVTTPSAVLAVRGTEYGVEVDGKGRTTVVVFSGVVEVQDRERNREAVRVTAGMMSRVGNGESPTEPTGHQMSRADFDGAGVSRRMGQSGSSEMGSGTMNRGASRSAGAGSGGSGRRP